MHYTYLYGLPHGERGSDQGFCGDIGKVRRVYVEYPKAVYIVIAGVNKQAAWRVDPKRSGKTGCMGDIGTHAFNLVEYITGLKAIELCAELNTFVPGRLLDDDGAMLIRYEGMQKVSDCIANCSW